jgi:hypothetical protein
MKITIDETNKRITVEQPVIIQELINFLTSHNIDLNEYTLDTNGYVYNPCIPSYPVWPTFPTYPVITYCSSDTK